MSIEDLRIPPEYLPSSSELEKAKTVLLEFNKNINHDNILQFIEDAKKVPMPTQDEINKIFLNFDNNLSISKKLDSDISDLQQKTTDLARELLNTKDESERKDELIEELKLANFNLQKEKSLRTILTQVNETAKSKLIADDNFKKLLLSTKECNSYILSIDIRRSTELMLKARTPQLFEKFITNLCIQLSKIITDNFGIFDKFTGDGILAYYPDFYSGKDSGLHAVRSAFNCHKLFNSYYKDHRHCFNSILQGIGLGIGIDYGKTHLALINTHTVIGAPVVYACRMSSAPANMTYTNQPAFERLSKNYRDYITFIETSIILKHEGETIAYNTIPGANECDPTPPDWDELITEFTTPDRTDHTS